MMPPSQHQDQPASSAAPPPERPHLEGARGNIRQLNPPAIKSLLAFGTPLIDIRDAQAYAAGHIPGALRIAAAELSQRAPELLPLQDRAVAVVCSAGEHSVEAARELENLGYTAVVCLRGGLRAWPDPLQEGQVAA